MIVHSLIQRKLLIVLGLILLLASVLRLYKLDRIPASPYWEEVALGYDAYSIAKTGKDFHGNAYPVIAFPSYGDNKPSGYFYAIVPFVKLLGLNVLAVRLPSALAGIASVVLVYLIGRQLLNQKTSLLAAFLFAIQPWAIQFSRGGWEVNLSLTLLLVGSWLLLRARKQPFFLVGAVVFYTLAMYTYHAARLFAPLMGGIAGLLLVVSWIKQKHVQKKQLVSVFLSLIVGIIFLFPLVSNLKTAAVTSRFTDTSIFSNPKPVLESNAAIAAHGNTRLAKILYHRYWFYAPIIVGQWISHFSPEFLFVRGDGNLRHWNGITGELFPIESIFIVVALLVVLRKSFYSKITILLIWIVLAAVPASLVTPAPHALRDLYAAPGYALLTAFGIATVFSWLKHRTHKKIFAAVIVLGYTFCFVRYVSWYFTAYAIQSDRDWQYGYRELYRDLANEKKTGESVYITREQGRPSMYYLFYSAYDPATIQAKGERLPKDQLELLQVDDYHFVDAISDAARGLIAASGGRIVPGGHILQNIFDLQGQIIWTIWRRE